MATVASTVRPTKLFIGGLSQNTTTKILRIHFSGYGKVLDCVAMFNQDGRARSFGYVTLDSLEAAERCVGEPQIVDGRVVDVKLAVPEASAGKKAPSTRARRAVSTSTSKRVQKTALSAAAPAFVPMDAGASSEVSDDYEPQQAVEDEDCSKSVDDDANMPVESPTPAPLTMEAMAARLAAAGVGAPPGLAAPRRVGPPPGFAPLTGLPAARPPLPAMPPPPAPPCEIAAEGKTVADDEDASTIAPSSSTVSPAVSQVQLEDSEAEDGSEDVASELLPSAGSALHAVGQCRPCNFFGKGRCTNGLDCEFCHLSHQKRKPTRQEKRERAAAWMDRQKAKAEEEAKALAAEKAKLAAEKALEEQAAPAVQPLAPTMVPSALPGLMFNFDCFSDESDDDDDVPAPAVARAKEAGVTQVPEEERVWSRELMLTLKAAMDDLGKNASEGEMTTLITVR